MAPRKKDEEEQKDHVSELLEKYDKMHFGESEIKAQEIISTGSFFFDLVLGGGYRSGSWARFYSDPECGKTAQGLRWGANWLKKFPDDGEVVIFNAEGRLTKDLLERSTLPFNDRNKVRIIPTNIYECVFGMTEDLVTENRDKKRYYIMVDSTDACERAADKDKPIADGKAEKIAGGATIVSLAGKRLSLLFSMNHHFLYMSSQTRDKMAQGPAAMMGPQKDASGGNAPKFYSSLTGHIKNPWTETYIWADSEKKKKIGVMVNILLKKTPNERTGEIISFPVKYGHPGGVWEAYEAMMICTTPEFGQKYAREGKGSYNIDEEFAKELTENNITFEPKMRSESGLLTMFDTNPQLTNYVLEKYRKLFIDKN